MANRSYTKAQFESEFPNSNACLDKIMELRYGTRPTCRQCKRKTRYHRIKKRRAYACQHCGDHVYPCVGTPFEKSTTPLYKWFYAMFLFTTLRNGVAAKELERHLGVTYKCAWRIGHQLRKLMAELDVTSLFGEIEADETYVGGRRPGPRGRGALHKTAVFGMKQCKGVVKTQVVPDTKRRTIEPIIRRHVRPGAVVHTDEWKAYSTLGKRRYRHLVVNHGSQQWVSGPCHTNSIEGNWSHIKRSIRGTHIAVSRKHL